eukprot:gnl/TRDRNA2_/TRDRNA2_169715_c1_seq2.p1 gnl/TRDRNA2_/TRDRNA2_169715_c1~~gnl/TRDRNA2_/TRDRNA2_169715_c1_seq2.p1  ORF type:complete len:484 (-),score=17.18 gnl/TRDRNA2_/TRDRNA2_169715_c1_seq2:181-1536(-)
MGGGGCDSVSKWFGGALGPEGRIYAVPYHWDKVLMIDPSVAVAPDPANTATAAGILDDVPRDMQGLEHERRPLRMDDAQSCNSLAESHIFIGSNLERSGRSLWVGGVFEKRSGAIFGIPSFAQSILRVDCWTGTARTFGEGMLGQDGPCKWAGGVLGPDHAIYGIPANANAVLRVDPATDTVETFGDLGNACRDWRWRGGVLGPDGMIYAIPFDARHVLRIDPATRQCALLEDDLGEMPEKWDGGVLGPDGAIYGIPSGASGVLKIDVATRRAQVLGAHTLGNESRKWSGGVLGGDGAIWGIPHKATGLLRIKLGDCCNAGFSATVVPLPPGEAQKEYGHCKWSGGVLGPDLSLWGIPCSAAQPLKVQAIPLEPKLIYYELALLLRISSSTDLHMLLQPLPRGAAVLTKPEDPGLLFLRRILVALGGAEGIWFLQRLARYIAGVHYLVGQE